MAFLGFGGKTDTPRKGVQAVPDDERDKPLTLDDKHDLKKRHDRALDHFKTSAAFFSDQRKREVEDLKFVDFDEQWDPSVKTQRAGNQSVSGLPPTPPRPMLTVNQMRGPCQQLANTRRAARLGLEFAPKGPGSTQDVAEVYEDIVRALQTESRAAIARNWAADRAEKAGLGWYRIDTEYSQETPLDAGGWNDQDIVWRRILNQASVYPDPHAQEPDFSDGRRWFVTEDIPIETYRERFPDSDLAAYDNGELEGVGDKQPKWVFTSNSDDGEDSQTVRIAECWEVIEQERTLVALTDGTAAFEDEIPPGKAIAMGPDAKRRRKTDRRVFFSLMNAVEYLEEPREVNGRFVPLIPCIGEEANVDGERRWKGIVRSGKGAAVSYNVMRSAQVEAIATASKAPYIGFARVIGQFMEWWKQNPVRNFPILPVEEAYDKHGNLLPIPTRQAVNTDITAITIAAQAAMNDVHVTTGIPPVSLGQLDPHERSGKAIAALQGQAEVGASGYMDNFVSITLAYEGKVVRDLIKHLFDRPGRIVPAVGVDEKRRLVMLNAPYTETPDGLPVMVPGWQPGQSIPKEIAGPPSPDGQPAPLQVKYLDMQAGEYSVAPVAGKSYATRREEAASAIGASLEALKGSPMGMALVPAWLSEQDWPGAKKMAKIAENALPPELKAAYEDEKPGAIPPQAQAMIQQLQQALQQAQQELATKQPEIQGKLQQTQMQETAETQRAQLEVQAGLQKAELAASASMANAQAKVDAENFRSYVDALESRLAKSLDLHMAKLTTALTHGHEAASQAADHTHEAALAVMKHQQALEQGQQAADLAPPPNEAA